MTKFNLKKHWWIVMLAVVAIYLIWSLQGEEQPVFMGSLLSIGQEEFCTETGGTVIKETGPTVVIEDFEEDFFELPYIPPHDLISTELSTEQVRSGTYSRKLILNGAINAGQGSGYLSVCEECFGKSIDLTPVTMKLKGCRGIQGTLSIWLYVDDLAKIDCDKLYPNCAGNGDRGDFIFTLTNNQEGPFATSQSTAAWDKKVEDMKPEADGWVQIKYSIPSICHSAHEFLWDDVNEYTVAVGTWDVDEEFAVYLDNITATREESYCACPPGTVWENDRGCKSFQQSAEDLCVETGGIIDIKGGTISIEDFEYMHEDDLLWVAEPGLDSADPEIYAWHTDQIKEGLRSLTLRQMIDQSTEDYGIWSVTKEGVDISSITGQASGCAGIDGTITHWFYVSPLDSLSNNAVLPGTNAAYSITVGSTSTDAITSYIPMDKLINAWNHVIFNISENICEGTPDWTNVNYVSFKIGNIGPTLGGEYIDVFVDDVRATTIERDCSCPSDTVWNPNSGCGACVNSWEITDKACIEYVCISASDPYFGPYATKEKCDSANICGMGYAKDTTGACKLIFDEDCEAGFVKKDGECVEPSAFIEWLVKYMLFIMLFLMVVNVFLLIVQKGKLTFKQIEMYGRRNKEGVVIGLVAGALFSIVVMGLHSISWVMLWTILAFGFLGVIVDHLYKPKK